MGRREGGGLGGVEMGGGAWGGIEDKGRLESIQQFPSSPVPVVITHGVWCLIHNKRKQLFGMNPYIWRSQLHDSLHIPASLGNNLIMAAVIYRNVTGNHFLGQLLNLPLKILLL